jgi:hypothetical protein
MDRMALVPRAAQECQASFNLEETMREVSLPKN